MYIVQYAFKVFLSLFGLLVGRQKASSSSQNQVLHFNKFSPHPEIPLSPPPLCISANNKHIFPGALSLPPNLVAMMMHGKVMIMMTIIMGMMMRMMMMLMMMI